MASDARRSSFIVLALFPFLIFVVATLSIFGNADAGALCRSVFLRDCFQPGAFQLISGPFKTNPSGKRPLKVSLGIIASISSTSLGMSAAIDTLNVAYKVKETRPLLKQYAIAIGLTLGMACWW
jgi:membrane protein